jgi:triosephosphate isomerase
MSAPFDRLLVGNWKMNLSLVEGCRLAAAVAAQCHNLHRTAVWLAPATAMLQAVTEAVAGSPLQIGVQNVCGVPHGAFTGEISVAMVRECGGSFAIVGHSERRLLFNEEPDLAAGRALGALSQGLPVIFCVGETAAERSRGEAAQTLARQLEPLLEQYDPTATGTLTVAYEPVWSIGTGNIPELGDIRAAHTEIAGLFERHGTPRPRILYGGSVAPDNLAALLSIKEVDGALVGGASLHAEKFTALIDICERSA